MDPPVSVPVAIGANPAATAAAEPPEEPPAIDEIVFTPAEVTKMKSMSAKDKMKFSMETLYSPNSTGMHAAYKHHFEEDIIKILENHFDNIFNEKIKLKE